MHYAPWMNRYTNPAPGVEGFTIVARAGRCAFLSAELASLTDEMLAPLDASGGDGGSNSGLRQVEAVLAWLEESKESCVGRLGEGGDD